MNRFPIGTRVRWSRPTQLKDWWVVTDHPQPGYVQLDGRGAIAEEALEELPEDPKDRELAELRELVVQQCQLIAGLSR